MATIAELRKKAGALYAAAQQAEEQGHAYDSGAAHASIAAALQKLSRAAHLEEQAARCLEQARRTLATRGVRPEGPPWGNATLRETISRSQAYVRAGRVEVTPQGDDWVVVDEVGRSALVWGVEAERAIDFDSETKR
jgi:hypothetical protein